MIPFKFSGRIAPDDPRHATTAELPQGARLLSLEEAATSPELSAAPSATTPTGVRIPPVYVATPWGNVPQYAPQVVGTANGYNPAGDCAGNYMSYRYQPNNNCYAYGCCITPNTFPQPGRYSGGTPFSTAFTAEVVRDNAVKDGLVLVGDSVEALTQFQQATTTAGHFVALMFSPPQTAIGGDPNDAWPGDYHWARCDDPAAFQSWSQKDGSDQVTNFDFAGQPITNPATANWTVNQGPVGTGSDASEYIVSYDFFCFMFVPQGGVRII
jgi:hypothetical protein